jgi:hypothetical protein
VAANLGYLGLLRDPGFDPRCSRPACDAALIAGGFDPRACNLVISTGAIPTLKRSISGLAPA